MSYEENPFQAKTYQTNQTNSIPPIIRETIHRKTIYDEVKVNKPIIMPVAYCNSNSQEEINNILNQKFNDTNYTNYNNYTYEVPSNDIGGINIDDNNHFTYDTTSNTTYNNNYNYNFNTTNLEHNTQDTTDENIFFTVTKINSINTYNDNYDINNLNHLQANKETDTTNYNYDNNNTYNQTSTNYISNIGNDNNYNIDYTNSNYTANDYFAQNPQVINTNNTNIYSTPYITQVEDNKEIKDARENKIFTTILTTNEQVTKEQKKEDNRKNDMIYPADDGINDSQNRNFTFGKTSPDSTEEKKNIITKNNNNIQVTKLINTNEPQFENNTNEQKEIKKPKIKALVKKITDDKVIDSHNDKESNNKNFNNAKVISKIQKIEYTNSINISESNKNPTNVAYDIKKGPIINIASNERIFKKPEEKDIKEKEEKKEKVNKILIPAVIKVINAPEEVDNNKEIKKDIEEPQSISIKKLDNINNISNNNINVQKKNENDIKQKIESPLKNPIKEDDSILKTPKGFSKVKVLKINKTKMPKDNIKKLQYSPNNNIVKPLGKSRHPKVKVVKLTDKNTVNINNNKDSVAKVEYNNVIVRRSNKFKNNSHKKNPSSDNDIINISEIRYEQSSGNEKDKKRDSGSDEKVIDDLDKNLKINDFSAKDEEKKDGLTESTYKRMKNADGLDEFDNNFNNHDLFYNRMKTIFDDLK